MNGNKYLKLGLKNKITVSLIGFFLVILSLIYFIVIPTIKEIRVMGDAIEVQREDLEKKYIKGQSLKRLTENLNKIEPKLELLNQIFINKNRELEFITSLENKAGKNQINQKINLSAPQKAENQNFQKTDLQISTKGVFNKQLQYLMDLESLGYYINVKLLELSLADDNGKAASSTPEKTNLNMYLGADTYWN